MLCKQTCLLFLLLFQLQGQGQQIYLKQYTVDDGLPSNETYQVLEDGRGNLLIATDRGAVRYDGYSFETIPHQDKLVTLPFYYIYKSPSNKIYYSSLKGAIYEYRKDTLHEFAFSPGSAALFNHPGILIANTISENKDTVWISYNNDFNYNYSVGSCFVTSAGGVRQLNQPDGIYFDLNRRFYYRQLSAVGYTKEKQPLYVSWPDGSATQDTVVLSWRGGYIRRLFHEQMGSYDLFCIGRKLLVYQNKIKIGSYLFPGNVLCFTPWTSDEIFVGFENGGARRYQLKTGNITTTTGALLDGYSVTCIYKDRQEGAWFSTMENGLFYSYPTGSRIWENESKIVSIVNRKNKVYVGYYSGEIQEFERTGETNSYRLPLPKGSYLNHFSFTHEDSLIAITDKGYYIRKNASWSFYRGEDALLLSASKDLLYGASASSPQLHFYKGAGKDLSEKLELSKRIISMYVDSNGDLWIGTWEGLLKYSNKRLIDVGKQNSVFSDRIVAIDELPDKSLVVASLGNGLVVSKQNRYFELNAGNGLRSSVINSMVIDGDDIWLGTNKGLARVNFINDSFHVVHFGIESGLPSADIHQFIVSNSLLYLKWVNRLVIADTRQLANAGPRLQTYLTSVRINDKELADPINPIFNHDQNSLTFSFNCPNLSSAQLQEYLYTIEGFDKTWHRTTERYAKYTNLPAGDYVFKVQAVSLRDGTPSTPASYRFVVKAAFWQTKWFNFIAIVVAALLLSALFSLRINSIKKKNRLLLELAENRSKALLQLIHPHFVSNVLNTIQGAVLKQDKMQAASLVSKFAKLMRLSLELGKEKMVVLADEVDWLKKYFELEEVRAPGSFAYHIEFVPPLNPATVMIPPMLVQPFVENAIKHGVMHLENRKGLIHLRFKLRENVLLCTVDDNGVGRKRSAQLNTAMQKDHHSSGIDITLNRLRLAHKEENLDFFYEVHDKQNPNAEPEGTTIIFSIPYKHLHEANSHGDH